MNKKESNLTVIDERIHIPLNAKPMKKMLSTLSAMP